MPATHVPTPDIPAAADDKMEAASVASSPSQEVFYEKHQHEGRSAMLTNKNRQITQLDVSAQEPVPIW
jgi:hypothetical protein